MVHRKKKEEEWEEWKKEKKAQRVSNHHMITRLLWQLIPVGSPWKVSHMSELKETGSTPRMHVCSVASVSVCVKREVCVLEASRDACKQKLWVSWSKSNGAKCAAKGEI